MTYHSDSDAPRLELCPDEGKCHHACVEKCWRVGTCGPLSNVFPHNEWPASVVREHGTPEAYEAQRVTEALRAGKCPKCAGDVHKEDGVFYARGVGYMSGFVCSNEECARLGSRGTLWDDPENSFMDAVRKRETRFKMTHTEPTQRAREFAVEAHGEQEYAKDVPYSVHLDAVVALVAEHKPEHWGVDAETAVVVAYLHDVVEDTDVGTAQVSDAFGSVVARAVALLTDSPGKNRKERKAATMLRMAAASGADEANRVGLLVKMADRLSNVKACVENGDSRLKMYRKEHAAFKDAVYRPNLALTMQAELDYLLG